MLIFESLIEFDAGRMIQNLEDLYLIEQNLWLFDILLGDFLDRPPLTCSQLLLGLVDHSISSLAQLLSERRVTLGLNS
jgi:hypothetical protein